MSDPIPLPGPSELPQTGFEGGGDALAVGMHEDLRFSGLEGQLRTQWEKENGSPWTKDTQDRLILRQDFLDWQDGNMLEWKAGRRPPTLKSRTEAKFREVYPDDAVKYDAKEKVRVYRRMDDDIAVLRMRDAILRETNSEFGQSYSSGTRLRGEDWNRIHTRATIRAYRDLINTYPEKAKGYAAQDERMARMLQRGEVAEQRMKQGNRDALLIQAVETEGNPVAVEMGIDMYQAAVEDVVGQTEGQNAEAVLEGLTGQVSTSDVLDEVDREKIKKEKVAKILGAIGGAGEIFEENIDLETLLLAIIGQEVGDGHYGAGIHSEKEEDAENDPKGYIRGVFQEKKWKASLLRAGLMACSDHTIDESVEELREDWENVSAQDEIVEHLRLLAKDPAKCRKFVWGLYAGLGKPSIGAHIDSETSIEIVQMLAETHLCSRE